MLLLAGSAILPATAGNQVLLRNLDPADGTAVLLAAGPNGLIYVVSYTRIVQLDSNGTKLASLDISQMTHLGAVAADHQGNVIVVGTGQDYNTGLILKADPLLQGVSILASLPASLNAVAIDAANNIYVTGSTTSSSFPVTAGAYQTKPPLAQTYGNASFAFVTKISPAGQVMYSTFFGSDTTNCFGGSYCIGKYALTMGEAIAVDDSGGVVIAGNTIATGLTTPGVISEACNCGYYTGHSTHMAGFVVRLQPSATQQLIWSTYLNASGANTPDYSVSLTRVAIDPAGNVIAGGKATYGLPNTPATFQPPVGITGQSGAAFLIELNANATAANWGTYLGTETSSVDAIAVNPKGEVLFTTSVGNVRVTGTTYSHYLGRVSTDGKALLDFYSGPSLSTSPTAVVMGSNGFVALTGANALWIEGSAPGPSLFHIANSGSGAYASKVTGTEVITIYGLGIGPSMPLMGQVQNGAYTTTLGGCQVLFNSTPAPLLYAGSGQINAVVPRNLSANAHMRLITPVGPIDGPTVQVSNVPIPGIFQDGTTGFAAALNQDGAINTTLHPARLGSIVSVFLTGGGTGFYPDGAIVPLSIHNTTATVWAVTQSYPGYTGSRSMDVIFAGDAPGIVAGVMQINFRVPSPLPDGQPYRALAFVIEVNGVATPVAQIAVAP